MIVFTSAASNLLAEDTNAVADVFIRDLQTNETQRISLGSDGTQANNESEGFAINADGRFVVFSSNASNLVSDDTNNVRDVFLRDRQTGTTERISLTSDGSQANGVSDLGAILVLLTMARKVMM